MLGRAQSDFTKFHNRFLEHPKKEGGFMEHPTGYFILVNVSWKIRLHQIYVLTNGVLYNLTSRYFV